MDDADDNFFEKREKTGCEKQPKFPFTSGRVFSNHCRKGVVKRPRSSPLQVGGRIPSTGGCIQRKNIFIKGAINRRLVRKYVEDDFTKVFFRKGPVIPFESGFIFPFTNRGRCPHLNLDN